MRVGWEWVVFFPPLQMMINAQVGSSYLFWSGSSHSRTSSGKPTLPLGSAAVLKCIVFTLSISMSLFFFQWLKHEDTAELSGRKQGEGQAKVSSSRRLSLHLERTLQISVIVSPVAEMSLHSCRKGRKHRGDERRCWKSQLMMLFGHSPVPDSLRPLRL